ncbi:hypothetical protein ASAP_2898 [Asaia bogorensis]|uniref:Uncharacterized protein n=1 Tax=Asaia bogorensis TaxID=91915 RepID=A0A060QJQ3_9PROT|nr:hypothetical protein ASAP_2898 [Asaia bogorensis]
MLIVVFVHSRTISLKHNNRNKLRSVQTGRNAAENIYTVRTHH